MSRKPFKSKHCKCLHVSPRTGISIGDHDTESFRATIVFVASTSSSCLLCYSRLNPTSCSFVLALLARQVLKAMSLVVDTFFMGILEAVTAGVTSGPPLAMPASVSRDFVRVTPKPARSCASLPGKLQVNPDGSWNVVTDSGVELDDDDAASPPTKQQPNGGSSEIIRVGSVGAPPAASPPVSNGATPRPITVSVPASRAQAAGGAGGEVEVVDLLSSDDDE